MLKFIFSAVFFLSFAMLQAQYRVAGTVVDSISGEPLPGATVRLDQNTSVVTSNANGEFVFENVSAGGHEVVITYVGYEETSKHINVSDQNLNLRIGSVASTVFTDEIVVTSTRATDKTPTTFTTLDKDAIRGQNFGQDVPFLLNWTPSVVTTSDAGAGVGYTGIRIRGSDGTRINVTVNGIPYTDSESLGTFWVDIPDIASSSQSIQIQRGVGTSTNGGAAFGASINLQTNTRNNAPYAEVINSGGSFRTHRHTIAAGTGLLNKHWIFEGRFSKIASDGFIDRASSDLSSYYFSSTYYAKNTIIKGVAFGGKERTYQAWYGVPEARLNNDEEAMALTAAFESFTPEQTAHMLNSKGRTFNPYTYKNQVDNYQQDNFQLHFSHQFGSAVTWNTAIHYTPGKGYYEEFQPNDKFSVYGLEPVTIGDSVISSSDLVRRRWLSNDFYGFTWSLNVDQDAWNVIWGGGWNRYEGDHFGEIIWAQVASVPTEYQYYLNKGDKRDFNSFVKVNYAIASTANLYVDLQYRKVDYDASGIENKQIPLKVGGTFNFFNPKLGATISLSDRSQLYASAGIAHREPVRDDFVNFPGNKPKAERLFNTEFGIRNSGLKHILHANIYTMNYTDQLVQTGELNDVGGSIRTNAGQSYRAGIELEGTYRVSRQFQIQANTTLSQNRIQSFTEVVEDYGPNFDEYNLIKIEHKKTPISYSPSIIAGSQLSYRPVPEAEIALLSKFVGKQFLDNTGNKNRMLDPYFVNDVRLSYTWSHTNIAKSISLSLLVNNVFNELYESNGYTWGYYYGQDSYRANYYYPQAGTNFLAMLSIKI